jgi:hypothetical protein
LYYGKKIAIKAHSRQRVQKNRDRKKWSYFKEAILRPYWAGQGEEESGGRCFW